MLSGVLSTYVQSKYFVELILVFLDGMQKTAPHDNYPLNSICTKLLYSSIQKLTSEADPEIYKRGSL